MSTENTDDSSPTTSERIEILSLRNKLRRAYEIAADAATVAAVRMSKLKAARHEAEVLREAMELLKAEAVSRIADRETQIRGLVERVKEVEAENDRLKKEVESLSSKSIIGSAAGLSFLTPWSERRCVVTNAHDGTPCAPDCWILGMAALKPLPTLLAPLSPPYVSDACSNCGVSGMHVCHTIPRESVTGLPIQLPRAPEGGTESIVWAVRPERPDAPGGSL